MELNAWNFLRFLYWSLRRNPTQAGHMLATLPCFVRNAFRLFRLARSSGEGRPFVAIALIEHMGDIVAAEPIARLARRRFPTGRLCWITRPLYASLPSIYADVDDVITVRCLTEWMLLQRLRFFDVVWDLHIAGRYCPDCQIPQTKPGQLPNEQNYYDFGNLLNVQCSSAGLPRLNDNPVVTPPPAAIAKVEALSLPSRFIVIHCASSDAARDWPEAKWQQLITRILSVDRFTIVEVGSRPMVIRGEDARRLSLCGGLSILETAEIIRRAELFIGIDSGPAHLGNAVGTPGVILLGTYRQFRNYLPYSGDYGTGRNAEIVRADKGSVAELSVETVFAAVMQRVAVGRHRSSTGTEYQ